MVSVIIPTYNRAGSILRSVNSVLKQSYSDIEVIVVDDGSTDNTKDILSAVSDKRLKYIYQENQGACVARNNGVSISTGDYIAFHDSDDEWHYDKLEKQIHVIESTNADIVFCQLIRCNSDTKSLVLPEMDHSGFFCANDLVVGISTQCLMMKRKVAETIPFDADMPRLQDLDWIMRAVDDYLVYGIKEVLVDYYFSDDSISLSGERLYRSLNRIHRKYRFLSKKYPKIDESLKGIILFEFINIKHIFSIEKWKYFFVGIKYFKRFNEKTNWIKECIYEIITYCKH